MKENRTETSITESKSSYTIKKRHYKNEPTSGNVGARENNVLLVLVHSSGVGDSLVVLDDGHRLTSQDGLVNSQGGGVDLDQS